MAGCDACMVVQIHLHGFVFGGGVGGNRGNWDLHGSAVLREMHHYAMMAVPVLHDDSTAGVIDSRLLAHSGLPKSPSVVFVNQSVAARSWECAEQAVVTAGVGFVPGIPESEAGVLQSAPGQKAWEHVATVHTARTMINMSRHGKLHARSAVRCISIHTPMEFLQ